MNFIAFVLNCANQNVLAFGQSDYCFRIEYKFHFPKILRSNSFFREYYHDKVDALQNNTPKNQKLFQIVLDSRSAVIQFEAFQYAQILKHFEEKRISTRSPRRKKKLIEKSQSNAYFSLPLITMSTRDL